MTHEQVYMAIVIGLNTTWFLLMLMGWGSYNRTKSVVCFSLALLAIVVAGSLVIAHGMGL
jgi:hypothetical protein